MLRTVLTRRRVYDERVEPCPLHTPDDRFIPLRAEDLRELLAKEFPDAGGVFDRLGRIVDHEAGALGRRLTNAYAPFNPDRDTLDIHAPGGSPSDRYRELSRVLGHVFAKANFEWLGKELIRAAIAEKNSHGLRVRIDPEGVREMGIWVRGRGRMHRRVRTLRHPWRGVMREMTLCRRLAVLAWMPEEQAEPDEAPGSGPVWLKMFRDIPLADLEALLPHAEVRMNWWDRFQAFGGAGGALGSTAYKIGSIGLTVVKLSAFLWVAVLGLLTLGFRAFFGYRRAKSKRDAQRTQHLYYQNLANNAAATHLLVAKVAQEELKEAMLAYAMAHAARDAGPVRPADLRARAESFIRERFDTIVRFDVQDAIETLVRVGLVASPTRIEVSPPHEASRALDRYLASGDADLYHDRCIDARVDSLQDATTPPAADPTPAGQDGAHP